MIRLAGDDWTGSRSGEWEVEQPDFERIEEAVRSLDGGRRTEVTVSIDEPFQYVSVSGGPELFLVTGELVDESILHLLGPAEEQGDIQLVCGGQLGIYPRSDLVAIDMALGAVREFLDGFPGGPASAWRVE